MEWVCRSRAGEKSRQLEKQLQARERAVVEMEQQAQRLLESKRSEAEAPDGARLRAKAEIDAAEDARQEAQRTAAERHKEADLALAQTREEVERMRVDARAERSAILDQARLDAAAAEIIHQAEEKAQKIVAEAEAHADRVRATSEQEREQELFDRADGCRAASRGDESRGSGGGSGSCERKPNRMCGPTWSAATERPTAWSTPHAVNAAAKAATSVARPPGS